MKSHNVNIVISNKNSHEIAQLMVWLGLLVYWKKRKLNCRSPQARGEPLLNKSYGEEGGDDIEFDHWQLCCPIDFLPLVLSRFHLSFILWYFLLHIWWQHIGFVASSKSQSLWLYFHFSSVFFNPYYQIWDSCISFVLQDMRFQLSGLWFAAFSCSCN